MQFHEESIIVDGLNASWFLADGVIERVHSGGVTAVNATIAAWHDPGETMDMIGQVLLQLDRHAHIAMQVESTGDIATAKAAGKAGFILGFQDTAPIADQIHLLRAYHKLGVRIIQLTYNFENRVGYGCQAPEDHGLTLFGKDVISEMNRLGILVDLSHCGERTAADAIEHSNAPVAITHANSADFFPNKRNKSDRIIKACAEKGGVVGAVSFPALLKKAGPVTLNDYIDSISYLVELVGIDHVGIGPDFMEEMPLEVAQTVLAGLPVDAVSFMQKMPPMEGFASVSDMPNLTAALLRKGFGEDDVRKIMGGNWLRLYGLVWS